MTKNKSKDRKQPFRIRKRLQRIQRDRIKRQTIKNQLRNRKAFFKLIIVSINDIDKFEQKEIMKKKPLREKLDTIC